MDEAEYHASASECVRWKEPTHKFVQKAVASLVAVESRASRCVGATQLRRLPSAHRRVSTATVGTNHGPGDDVDVIALT